MRFQVACAALFLILGYSVDVESACCYKCNSYTCNDCTAGTPNCGYGPCNIFGCACKGGCRTGPGCENCHKRSLYEMNPETSASQLRESNKKSEKHLNSIFELADHNRDGHLDESEARFWVSQSGLHPTHRETRSIHNEFSRLDKNNDGFLSRSEIDH